MLPLPAHASPCISPVPLSSVPHVVTFRVPFSPSVPPAVFASSSVADPTNYFVLSPLLSLLVSLLPSWPFLLLRCYIPSLSMIICSL